MYFRVHLLEAGKLDSGFGDEHVWNASFTNGLEDLAVLQKCTFKNFLLSLERSFFLNDFLFVCFCFTVFWKV